MSSDLTAWHLTQSHVPLIFRSTGIDANGLPTYGHPLSFTHVELLWLADEFNQGIIQEQTIATRYNLSETIISEVTSLNTGNPFTSLDQTGYMAFRASLHFMHTLASPEHMADYISKMLSDQQVATIARDETLLKP